MKCHDSILLREIWDVDVGISMHIYVLMLYTSKAKIGWFPQALHQAYWNSVWLKSTERKIRGIYTFRSSHHLRDKRFWKRYQVQELTLGETRGSHLSLGVSKDLLSNILSPPSTSQQTQHDASDMETQAALSHPSTHALWTVDWYRTLPTMVCLRTKIENLQFQ